VYAIYIHTNNDRWRWRRSIPPCTFDLHNNNNNILNHVNRPVQQRYLCTGRPGHCAAKRRGRARTIIYNIIYYYVRGERRPAEE